MSLLYGYTGRPPASREIHTIGLAGLNAILLGRHIASQGRSDMARQCQRHGPFKSSLRSASGRALGHPLHPSIFRGQSRMGATGSTRNCDFPVHLACFRVFYSGGSRSECRHFCNACTKTWDRWPLMPIGPAVHTCKSTHQRNTRHPRTIWLQGCHKAAPTTRCLESLRKVSCSTHPHCQQLV